MLNRRFSLVLGCVIRDRTFVPIHVNGSNSQKRPCEECRIIKNAIRRKTVRSICLKRDVLVQVYE